MALTVNDLRILDGSGEKVLLDGIRFTLEKGSLTLLLGQTGAGKSTLLDALSGLTPVAGGTIAYDRMPLWSGKRLNGAVLSRFGHVFQMPEQQLFARTVQKEFEFSLRFMKLPKQEVKRRSREAMGQLGLPLSMLDRPPLFLSGGEKRRVALASTYCIEPEWLLLDEPTAGMDPPAVSQFIQLLAEWKREKAGSALIATHQVEEMLPLADRFLFLREGRLIADVGREELVRHPHLWEEAGLDMPLSLSMAETLRSKGADVPDRLLAPQEMAAIILRGRTEAARSGEWDCGSETGRGAGLPGAIPGQLAHGKEFRADLRPVEGSGPSMDSPADSRLLQSLDPRVKWLVYALFSIAVLLQSDWWGVLAGAAVAAWWHSLSGLKIMQVLRLGFPFLLFTAISFVVAGIQLGPETTGRGLGFAMDSAMLVLFRMGKIGVAMHVGIVFALTTSFYRMKLGLEQSLEGLRRFKLPVGEFALTAALMIRFVPVLQKELNRFSRIVRARGKEARHSAFPGWRHMPALLIPLMISLMQWASDLTMALLVRGAEEKGRHQNIRSVRLRMDRTDVQALLAGTGIIALLVAWRLLHG